MSVNWLRPNVFVVQGGKLVPRPSTPEQKKNYRYIPYDPIGNPTPDDYFRETITRLQKQNTSLKAELASKLQGQTARNNFLSSRPQSEEVKNMQDHIAMLLNELATRDRVIEEKNQQLNNKDKRILELSNQTTRLHLRINSVVKQIESLNLVMSKKDEEILNKKEQIEEYCRALDRLAQKEKEEAKTMFSENYMTTPKIEEKDEEDQFYSIECNSLHDRHSLLSHRYRTPDVQSFKVDDAKKYNYRSQGQIDYSFNSAKISRQNSQEDLKQSQHSIQQQSDFKNWAQSQLKNSFSFDLLKQQVDPLGGGLPQPRRN